MRCNRLPFDALPRIWDTATVFILGGGPSLRGFDYERLRGREILALNAAVYAVPWARVLYFNDNSFFEQHGEVVRWFEGLRITASRAAKAQWPSGLLRPEHRPSNVFSRESTWVRAGRSSGHNALNVVSLLGARTVVLLGFDCRTVDGRSHGHDHYERRPCEDVAEYGSDFLPAWNGMDAMAREVGLTVLNATPASVIQEFPSIDLNNILFEQAF